MKHNLLKIKPYLTLLFLLAGCMFGDPLVGFSQGGLMIESGAQVRVAGNASIVIADGKWQNDGVYAAGTGLVRIEGNGSTLNATIGGLSTNGSFYNLTLDKAANGAKLTNDIVVSHQLLLTKAALDLNTHRLTVSSSDSDAIARTAGYLLSEQPNNSSMVAWYIGTAVGLHTIPFGALSGTYIPVQLRVTAGNLDTVKVSTYPTNAANQPLPTTPTLVTNVFDYQGLDNSARTVDRFWEINPTGGTGVITLTLTAQASEVGSITDLKAQRWDSLSHTWDAPILGQISSATAVQVSNVSKYTTFAVTQALEPLTVEFLSFDAFVRGPIVVLKWVTGNETNSDHFSMQRSVNGSEFTEIGTAAAAGNSHVTLHYASEDQHPLQGMSFYRIVEYGIDGRMVPTAIRAVHFDGPQSMSYALYPNPTTQGILALRIEGGKGENVTVRLADIFGKVLSSSELQLDRDAYEYSFEIIPQLPKGNYIVWIASRQGNKSFKVSVQ